MGKHKNKKDKKKKERKEINLYGLVLGGDHKNELDGQVNIEQGLMNDVADTLENYLDIASNYLIIEDISYQEKERAMKIVKKAIKKLREGDPSAVWDSFDRYSEEVLAWRESFQTRKKYGYY